MDGFAFVAVGIHFDFASCFALTDSQPKLKLTNETKFWIDFLIHAQRKRGSVTNSCLVCICICICSQAGTQADKIRLDWGFVVSSLFSLVSLAMNQICKKKLTINHGMPKYSSIRVRSPGCLIKRMSDTAPRTSRVVPHPSTERAHGA